MNYLYTANESTMLVTQPPDPLPARMPSIALPYPPTAYFIPGVPSTPVVCLTAAVDLGVSFDVTQETVGIRRVNSDFSEEFPALSFGFSVDPDTGLATQEFEIRDYAIPANMHIGKIEYEWIIEAEGALTHHIRAPEPIGEVVINDVSIIPEEINQSRCR